MPLWHDPFTSPPEFGATIMFRRYPEVTPPIIGVWNPDDGNVLLSHDTAWQLPCDLVSRWREPSFPIPIPGGGNPTTWRDPVIYPPADQQPCWIRRFLGATAVLPVRWSTEWKAFYLTVNESYQIWLEWHFVWQWKPR
jgi:hypothetical protein